MKTVVSAAAVLLTVAAPAAAQPRAEITPFVGYLFGNSVSTRTGKVGIAGDMTYGALLDINVRPGGQLEISYGRQDTKLTWEPLTGAKRDLTDIAVNYFQIGGLGYMMQGQAQPFMSFTLGATWYDPKQNAINDGDGERQIDDEWRFSMILGLGAKYFASDRVGLRIQGRLYGTFLDTGGSIFCGSGTGCSLGFFGAGVLQGDFSGGVTIAVG